MIGLAQASVLRKEVGDLAKPPERLTVPEAAERNIILDIKGGYYGEWSNKPTHLMVEPAECLTSRSYDAVIMVAPSQTGKALSLDTRIPTPSGWTTMGALRLGDSVFDRNGSPTTVVFATEVQHGRKCYNVSFSTGETIVADADHLWIVDRYYWLKPHWREEVKTTRELCLDLVYNQRENTRRRFRYHVKTCGALGCNDAELPIDPYLLGVWLGDGMNVHASISSHEDDAPYYVERLHQAGHTTRLTKDGENTVKLAVDLRDKLTTHCQRGHEFAKVGRYGGTGGCCECARLGYWRRKHGVDRNGDEVPPITLHNNTFLSRLHKLNLVSNKHIPAIYLRSSEHQRMELMRGLMDTDGSCSKKAASVEFSGVHKLLVDGYMELARSLGFKPSVKKKRTTWVHKGVKHEGTAFRVTFPVSKGRQVFALPRKAESLITATASVDFRQIVAIEEVQSVPVRCIQVDAPSHSYLAGDGMIPTHNTQALCDNWAAHTICHDPVDFLLVEKSEEEARKHSKTKLDRTIFASPNIRKKMSAGHGNNVHEKRTKSGAFIWIKWPTKNTLSGATISRIALTDYDRMPDDIDGEGPAFDLAYSRRTYFGSRGMVLAESSPSKPVLDPKWTPKTPHEAPPTIGILGLYNTGDRRRVYSRCPHCEEWISPEASPEALHIPDDVEDEHQAAMMASLICPASGCLIGMEHEREFKRLGRWVREGQTINPDGSTENDGRIMRRASFWLPGWFAAFATWPMIITEYLMSLHQFERTGDEDSLKSAVNTKIGGPYWSTRDKAASENNAPLSDRVNQACNAWKRHHVPYGVRTITAIVDVQKRSFEVAIVGRGKDNERWIMDRFPIRKTTDDEDIRPAAIAEHWNELTKRVMLNTYQIDEELSLRVHVMLIDLGGAAGTSERAYDYWRSLPAALKPRCLIVKGVHTHGGRGLVLLKRPDSRGRKDRPTGGRGDVPVLEIRSNKAKDMLSGDLARDTPGRGYIHIPGWISNKHIEELSAEKCDAKGRWSQIGSKRNELWDHMYYEIGAWVHNTRGDNVNWDRPQHWLKELTENSDVISAREAKSLRSTELATGRIIAANDFKVI